MSINIGIAGSNGRQTLIEMISIILRNSNKKLKVLTDFDENSIDEFSKSNEYDYVIYDCSAKILENIKIGLDYNIGFDISLIFNIENNSPDCLGLINNETNNEYTIGYFNYYEKIVAKVYEGTKSFCVFNASNTKVDYTVQNAEVFDGAKAIGFSARTPSRSQVGVVESEIIDRAFYEDNSDPLRFLEANHIINLNDLPFTQTPVKSYYNWLVECVCAAICIARALNISIPSIQNSLRQFNLRNNQASLIYKRNLSNEPDYFWGEINYINDGESQNIIDSKNNIVSYNKNSVIWIGGGNTNFFNYKEYVNSVKEYLLAAIIIGTQHSPIYQAFKQYASNLPVYLIEPTFDLKWIKNSIKKANELASENNIVIFSPAADISSIGDSEEILKEFTNEFLLIKKHYDMYEFNSYKKI